jgi:hypothetical protein
MSHGGGFYGGGYSGGAMRVAPSHSYSPGISGASRMPSMNGHTLPSVNSGHGLSGTGNSGAHSAFRMPTNGAGSASNIGRSTSWNHASHAQLQHVNSNIASAVKNHGSLNHSLTSTNLRNATASGALNGAKAGSLSPHANAIRNNWNGNPNGHCMNGRGWWAGRNCIGFGGYGLWGGWGYSPWLNFYPWWYWWGNPGWGYCSSYLPYGWNNGYYYNYGPGGNVLYQNGQVVVDDQVVGTDAEYAQSAAELANVDPAELKAVASSDWLPLGTFSWAITQNEVDPARVIQLAVSRNGLVSGTVHNRTSGNTYTIQGRVDKETQRLAFTIGDDRNTIMETGIYNLTQDQTPVLCHFGLSETQTYNFVRLPEPEHEPATQPLPGVNPPPAPPAPEAGAAAAPPADAAPVAVDVVPAIPAGGQER